MAGRFPALMRRLVSCSYSRSGGVDFEAAGRLGINAQRALSLPGRVARSGGRNHQNHHLPYD